MTSNGMKVRKGEAMQWDTLAIITICLLATIDITLGSPIGNYIQSLMPWEPIIKFEIEHTP